jgi:hypothetical protein
MKPVPVRIAVKDKVNDCALFSPRVTVAREMTNTQNGQPNGNGNRPPAATQNTPPLRSAADARDAFNRLFKDPT